MSDGLRERVESQERVPAGRDLLDTPALVVDLDALDANIAAIAATCRRQRVQWRPHVKSHASAPLAQRLMKAGAVGVTCAKLGEAELMAAAGVREVLVANQVVGPRKIARLVSLAQVCDVIVAVDNLDNVRALGSAASANGVRIGVVVEVDIGMRRAGVAAGSAAVELARGVMACDGLRFEGFEGWEGHASAIADPAAKRLAVASAVGLITGTADQARAAGIPVRIVSCGGTATFPQTGGIPGVTEVQAGGGIFGDRRCREISRVDHRCALTLVATVTSRPDPRYIVCDSGRKSMGEDAPGPRAIGLMGVESLKLSAEHATLVLADPGEAPGVGDRLEFEVGYSDGTIHLHDELIAMRSGAIEAVWPIGKRGKMR